MRVTAVAALVVSIALLLSACLSTEPHPCTPITTYLFIGTPGTVVIYNGTRITIPRLGYVEVVSDGDDHARLLGAPGEIALPAFAKDDQGRVTIHLTRGNP